MGRPTDVTVQVRGLEELKRERQRLSGPKPALLPRRASGGDHQTRSPPLESERYCACPIRVITFLPSRFS
jgi:hypothetical protein